MEPKSAARNLPVINVESTSVNVGVSNAVVREMLVELLADVPNTIKLFKAAHHAKHYAWLRREARKCYDGLQYTGVPALTESVFTLLDALHAGEEMELESAYQIVLSELKILLPKGERCGENKNFRLG